jgi:hypothetical protein
LEQRSNKDFKGASFQGMRELFLLTLSHWQKVEKWEKYKRLEEEICDGLVDPDSRSEPETRTAEDWQKRSNAISKSRVFNP